MTHPLRFWLTRTLMGCGANPPSNTDPLGRREREGEVHPISVVAESVAS